MCEIEPDVVREVAKENERLLAELEQYKKVECFTPPITCSDCCSLLREYRVENERLQKVADAAIHYEATIELDDDGRPKEDYDRDCSALRLKKAVDLYRKDI